MFIFVQIADLAMILVNLFNEIIVSVLSTLKDIFKFLFFFFVYSVVFSARRDKAINLLLKRVLPFALSSQSVLRML